MTDARGPWDRYGWVMGALWLVFLAFPLHGLLTDDRSVAIKVAGVAILLVFAAVYVHGLITLPRSFPPRYDGVPHLLAMAALGAGVWVVIGSDELGTLPYIVALAIFSVRLPLAIGIGVACTALPPVWAGPDAASISLVVVLVLAATLLVRLLEGGEARHLSTQRELEIVAERERVARDVHDVLGHSLTVVAAKAELAERLMDRDPERARDELKQIQSLTRTSLAEIRATVAGLRVARLGDELEAARGALDAAGIGADLPENVEVVDPRQRILLAWVLREAVTNVVRHSGATRCTVTLSPQGLVVADDGRGTGGAPEGNGLRGIRERVASAGGRLEVHAGPDGRGTVVEVKL